MQSITAFARIGRAPIIRALGIQENYTEVSYEEKLELDREATGCFACPNFHNIEYAAFLPEKMRAACEGTCANCPRACYHKTYIPHKKYINEKNRYGYAKRIKGVALKLFLVYHFAGPDNNGFVKGMNRHQLAEMLSCSVRSVVNANKTLQDYGYIMLSNCGNGFNVLLKDYKTYALPADQGGRGYATFNRALLNELLALKDANQLRIVIRSALDLDRHKNASLTRKLPDIRRYLPKYCKDGIVKKALLALPSVFHVSLEKSEAHITLDDRLLGRHLYEEQNQQHTEDMRSYVASLDGLMDQANKAEGEDPSAHILESLGIHTSVPTAGGNRIFLKYNLSDADYIDLGRLCTTFSKEKVQEALRKIYDTYIPNRSLRSIGALIRTVLKKDALVHRFA